jgi:subtilisin family serine protease
MQTNYPLLRGGQTIDVQKEENWFTAVLPKSYVAEEIYRLDPVLEMKNVFQNVYKVKAYGRDGEDLMQKIRTTYSAESIVHHAYNPVGDELTRYYLTDKIVVTFLPQTSIIKIEKIMQMHGLEYVRGYAQMPDTHLFVVTKSANKNPLKVANDLMEQKAILLAEPNLINRFQSFYEPTDNLFDRQWHLKSEKGIEIAANASVEAHLAWDITKGDRNIIVAVLDDGFDLTHPDFQGEGKIVFAKDFVDGDTLPFPQYSHGNFHGTPVAGVAIGEENGQGIVGVAPDCAFMPVRFDLRADDNLLWEMFNYVGKNAHVISNSWGPVPVYAPLSTLMSQKITQLAENGGPDGRGCVVLFAAGNFNAPIYKSGKANFEWLHPSRGIVKTKGSILNGHAAHPDVLTIAASTSQNQKAVYSGWGKEVDFCAPSDNFHPLYPQERVPGRKIWTADNHEYGDSYSANSRYTGKFGGTSSSTPLAAGIAALIWSVNPKLSAKEVTAILKKSTDKIEDSSKDIILKHNKGYYNSRGHSEWFGYGKLNAYKAVLEAKKTLPKVTGNTIETPKKSIKEGVYIVSAMVNPFGTDEGRETISILNARPEAIDLKNWSLVDGWGRVDKLSTKILQNGEFYTLDVGKIKLPNQGGKIRLLNDEWEEVDAVEYTWSQGSRYGWQIKF